MNIDRFKLRYWDCDTNKMHRAFISGATSIENILIFEIDDGVQTLINSIDINSGFIMQCTGLRDKNGTLIFEGDILSFAGERSIDSRGKITDYVQPVVWNDYARGCDCCPSCFDPHICSGFLLYEHRYVGKDMDESEIIGHIFESKWKHLRRGINDGRTK